ncbi:hypothetical protein BT69DRAFT_318052 [Atractiella rhizophila]|nr:hypothetical protein BT69DRAFT_318052 [Atractiella rhizophila]
MRFPSMLSSSASSSKTTIDSPEARRKEKERESKRDPSLRSDSKVREWMEKGSQSTAEPGGRRRMLAEDSEDSLYEDPLATPSNLPSEYQTAPTDSSLSTFDVPIDLISFDGHAEEDELQSNSVHDYRSLHRAWEQDRFKQAEERYKSNKEKEMQELDQRLQQWMETVRGMCSRYPSDKGYGSLWMRCLMFVCLNTSRCARKRFAYLAGHPIPFPHSLRSFLLRWRILRRFAIRSRRLA